MLEKYAKYFEMLTYKRPARTKYELKWIARFLDSVPGMAKDNYGNRYIRVGESSTLFSCHTDTQHRKTGKQKILVDQESGIIFKDDKEPLGADDCTGAYIMLHMIEHGVPGLYVFHRDEEIGGKGSKWIAANDPSLLLGIERAIAFDRRNDTDVITHQGGQRCCSDAFASALSLALGKEYRADNTGLFTDTANYTDLVAECTNISVGYEFEHTPDEYQQLAVLDHLLSVVTTIEWDKLPVARTPFSVNDIKSDGFANWYEAYELCYNNPDKAADLLIDAYGLQSKRGYYSPHFDSAMSKSGTTPHYSEVPALEIEFELEDEPADDHEECPKCGFMFFVHHLDGRCPTSE